MIEVQPQPQERESWSSQLGFMLASAGSAVGLANIWRFPYIVGQNGGAAFILVYLLCLLLVGLPVFFTEIAIGRNAHSSPYGAFKKLGRTTPWALTGKSLVLVGFIVSAFYSVIAGWIMGYFVEALRGSLIGLYSPAETQDHYHSLISSPIWTVGWHAAFMLASVWIVYTGVQKGIERSSKWMMPLLLLILLGLVLRGLTTDKAAQGLHFLFSPDWSKSMNRRIYLDNNATTGLDPRVVQVLQAELHEIPQNPSSVHFFGQQARGKLHAARRDIAAFFGVQPQEVIFTSSATEGLNLILRGLFEKHGKEGHVITSCVEHSAIYKTLQTLQQKGLNVTFLQTGLRGAVTAESVATAIRPDTKFIILMGVNNETGVRTPVEEIARLAQQEKISFVVDGVAWLGKEVFSIPAGVSAICFSGHKIHAPKGIGLMIVRQNFTFPALITGGGQEYQRRSGTENMLGIVGLAEAIRVLQQGQEQFVSHMQDLQQHFEQQLLSKIGDVTIHGEGQRVCNTTNVAFHGVDAESLLMALDQIGIAASHGSACSSGALEPSRILLNMGQPRVVAKSSMRFSLSRFTTRNEIDRTLSALEHLIARLR